MSPNRNDSSALDPSSAEPDHPAFRDRLEIVVRGAGGPAALAEASGVSRRMIDRYRAGSDPSRSTLVALARASGVSIAWLADGQGEMREAGDNTLDADLEEILRLVSRPGAVRSYGKGRLTVQMILRAIMQHGLEQGWTADRLARISRIGAVLYQIDSLTNDQQAQAAGGEDSRSGH
jgi:transcriptional regulator with XRE-family HTH domain